VRIYGRLILAVLTFAAGAATLAVPNGHAPPEAGVSRPREIRSQTLRSTTDLIEVSFQIPEPQLLISAQHQGQTRIEIAGAATYSVKGYPEVPVITQYIAIPHCDGVDLTATAQGIESSHNVTIALHKEDGVDPSARRLAKGKPYGEDADFHETWARLVDVQYLRGQALARIELYPTRFNAQRRTISTPREITVQLRPVNPSGPLAVHAGPLQTVLDALIPNLSASATVARQRPGRITQSEGGHVFWCDTSDDDWEAARDFVTGTSGADYLMIVADELVADTTQIGLVEQIAQWHASYDGFNVAIVRMKQIDDPVWIAAGGGTPAVIRDFIKSIYDSQTAAHMGDQRLGYVLLVGDAYNPSEAMLIPPYYWVLGSGYHTYEANASDTYYSLLSGTAFTTDLIPDILIGRLPIDADDENWELQNVVQKILNYEPFSSLDSWSNKVLLMSGGDDGEFTFEGEGLAGFEDFFDAVEALDKEGSRQFTQMHRLAWNSSSAFSKEVCDSIGRGFGLVGLFDHANPVNFADAFYPLHYDTLANDTAFAWPLVLSFGSYSGYFDRLAVTPGYSNPACCPSSSYIGGIPCQTPDTPIDNCDALAERLLVQAGGASGVIAYSRTYQAQVVQRAFANVFRSILQSNLDTFGAALVGTKLLTNDFTTTSALNLLGDPALNFRRQFDTVDLDSFDVAVRGSDINFTAAVHGWASSGVAQTVSIALTNKWKDPVEDVPVEVWNGQPGPGATMLTSFVVPGIAAYDTTVWEGSLGTLANGDYDIYVVADPEQTLSEPAIANNVAFATIHVRPYSDGFPVVLSGSPTAGVTIADLLLDGTSSMEIVAHVGEYYPVYSGEGEFIAQSYGRISMPPMGNVFRSDKRHVVAWYDGFLGERIVNVFDGGTGAIVSSALRVPDKLNSDDPPPILFDLGSPDSMLLVFRTQLEGAGLSTNLRAYSFSGELKWVRPIGDLAHGTYSLTRFAMAAADITGDGASDIVFGYASSQGRDSVGVIDGLSGDRVWSVGSGDGDPKRLYVRVTDLERDGENEIISNTLESDELRVVCYEGSGATRWSVTVGTPDNPLAQSWRFFSCGDLDQNGTNEIVFTEMNRLGVIESSGSSASVDRFVDLTDAVFFSTPIVLDIDANGSEEIVGLVRTWNRSFNEFHLAVHVYSSDLTLIEAYDYPWVQPLDDRVDRVIEPAAGDIDGDGTFELAFATPDGVLHAVDLGTAAGRVDWTQVYGDAMRTSFPYERRLSGSYAAPVAINHGARILADATFEGGLTITAPSIVRVAEDAIIAVENGLWLHGGQYDSVIVALDEQATEGATWQGIVASDLSSRGEIRCAVMANVAVAIESDSPVRIRSSRFSGIENTAVVSLDSLWLVDSVILSPGGHGVELTDGAIGTIDRTVISSPEMTGILCDGCGSGTLIRQTTVESAGDYGFQLISADGLIIESAVAEDCGSAGIRFESATGTIETSRFENNAIGIACLDESSPTVSESHVLGSAVGVGAVYDSYPVLGDGASSPEVGGNNCIHNNSSHHVVNLSPGGTILARWNYWGSQCCNAAKFSGSVACSNCVSSSACSGAAAQIVIAGNEDNVRSTPSSLDLVAAIPNPFNPTTRIRFAVPEPGADVTITLYNVQGQRLLVLQNGFLQAGSYDRLWDGRDRQGAYVASGVYFAQMKSGAFRKTLKIVLLK
jgi:hypothetical protein